jgi:hypothetical protein
MTGFAGNVSVLTGGASLGLVVVALDARSLTGEDEGLLTI